MLSAPPLCGSVYFLCLVYDAQLNGVQTLQSPQAETWGALAFCHFSLLTLEASDLFLQEVSLLYCLLALSRFPTGARAQLREPSDLCSVPS